MTDAPELAERAATSRLQLLRLLFSEKREPAAFHEALAVRTLRHFPFHLERARVVDLGCGPGFYTNALRAAGATVIPVDADATELNGVGSAPFGAVLADGAHLALADASVDGVFCSNVLEHAPDANAILGEIERVVAPGGWAWISWTNWYSPWGGHNITPFQYLGPRLGPLAYRTLYGEPRKNVPGKGLFPLHLGRTLGLVRAKRGFRLVDAMPRYYPSQRWVLKVPGLREVATWNCVLVLERVGADAH